MKPSTRKYLMVSFRLGSLNWRIALGAHMPKLWSRGPNWWQISFYPLVSVTHWWPPYAE
jgi:hypothetical protein